MEALELRFLLSAASLGVRFLFFVFFVFVFVGVVLRVLGVVLGNLGAVLGLSWGDLGASWGGLRGLPLVLPVWGCQVILLR